MNYLISISWHILPIFTIEQVLEKIEKYDKTHKIAGIEIASKDFETMKKAVEFSIKHNYIFQCHAPKISTNDKKIGIKSLLNFKIKNLPFNLMIGRFC